MSGSPILLPSAVEDTKGEAAGGHAVMASPHAWLSYALRTGRLIESAPTTEDMRVETFGPAAEAGKFVFTVSVKDVAVGSEAVKANLQRIFGLEGATTLDSEAFSSDKVDIEFDTPVNGNVKFTAKPKEVSSGAFFMKVKMLP